MSNFQELLDSGFTVDEILSGGMATTYEAEEYEDTYAIPQLKTSPRYTRKEAKTRDDANYDTEF